MFWPLNWKSQAYFISIHMYVHLTHQAYACPTKLLSNINENSITDNIFILECSIRINHIISTVA